VNLRLEGQGLFSKRVRAPRGLREGLVPGLYRVVLHPRTDGEGFLTGLHLAHRELLSPAPLGEAPGEPLRFLLLGEWLGGWAGCGWCLGPRKSPRPGPLRRPHLAPAPGGWLVGEAFPCPGPLPGSPAPGPQDASVPCSSFLALKKGTKENPSFS